MIVRNEERFLDDCLRSIAEVVDEIVIVDTGSVDRTLEIARSYPVRLFERAWDGDFSAARNVALAHATGDWILYIDADERLGAGMGDGALQAALDPSAVACRVLLHPKVGSTPYHEVRLFRRDERIRFRGIIHEAVLPDIHDVAAGDGSIIADSDVHLYHVGYEGDLTQKFARNLPLLEREVEATPERVFLWVDMAQSLLGLGRHDDAEAACWKAIAAADAFPDTKQKYDASLAWEMLVRTALLSDAQRAADVAAQALAAFPEQHSLRLACAEALFAAGEAASILPLLLDLVAVDADAFVDPMVAYDKRVFGEWAYHLLGAVYVRLGRRSEAGAAFRQAALLAPESLVYRVKAAAFANAGVP